MAGLGHFPGAYGLVKLAEVVHGVHELVSRGLGCDRIINVHKYATFALV